MRLGRKLATGVVTVTATEDISQEQVVDPAASHTEEIRELAADELPKPVSTS